MNTMVDLNDVVVFARVVEAGSFTAAARLLAMPKTTVSRRVAALEREVGVRLLQRTTRSLNLTDAGRLYYEQSSQGLRTIEEANLRLAEARAEPLGTIRISAPVGFGGHFLIRAVVDFLTLYPKTNVELRLTDDKLNLIEDGIDLAFRTGRLEDSTLIARKLGSTHRLLWGGGAPAMTISHVTGCRKARPILPAIDASSRAHRSQALIGCWMDHRARKLSWSPGDSPPMRCRRWWRPRSRVSASPNCPSRWPTG